MLNILEASNFHLTLIKSQQHDAYWTIWNIVHRVLGSQAIQKQLLRRHGISSLTSKGQLLKAFSTRCWRKASVRATVALTRP